MGLQCRKYTDSLRRYEDYLLQSIVLKDEIQINVSLMYKDNLTRIDLIDRIRRGYGWEDIGIWVSTKSELPDSSATKAVFLTGPSEPRGSEGCMFSLKIKQTHQQAIWRGLQTSCSLPHQCDLATLYWNT